MHPVHRMVGPIAREIKERYHTNKGKTQKPSHYFLKPRWKYTVKLPITRWSLREIRQDNEKSERKSESQRAKNPEINWWVSQNNSRFQKMVCLFLFYEFKESKKRKEIKQILLQISETEIQSKWLLQANLATQSKDLQK